MYMYNLKNHKKLIYRSNDMNVLYSENRLNFKSAIAFLHEETERQNGFCWKFIISDLHLTGLRRIINKTYRTQCIVYDKEIYTDMTCDIFRS